MNLKPKFRMSSTRDSSRWTRRPEVLQKIKVGRESSRKGITKKTEKTRSLYGA